MRRQPICVLGAGSWGTALAMVLARSGRKVRLLARDKARAQAMEQARENRHYLPDIRFPKSLHVMHEHEAALKGAVAAVVALPCEAVEDYLPEVADCVEGPAIAACKGLHPETLRRTDQILAEYIDPARIAILSGPSFAPEVARGRPTAITMAAHDIHTAEEAAALFEDSNFRVYTSTDVAGVALGGALKNVIAIAAGIASGLQLGHNAAAALITRGIAEMSRLAVVCGGRQETLNGLSGLGDLVLTCTGELSRNRRMGIALAQGMDAQAAREHIGQVVEGIRTADAAIRLAEKYGIEIPIMSAVHAVLQGKQTPMDAVHALLARPEKAEGTVA
ncbi:MAG: NAD(P)H-dependent glycerol-3-phosphate dehydrogenase [Mariprofundaceae bacterium]